MAELKGCPHIRPAGEGDLARIALCLCTAQVIKNTLATFGVSAPTRM